MPLVDLLTPTWIKDRYAFGPDFTDDSGDAYPDALWAQSARNAVSILEQRLDISLSGIREEYKERHDRLDMDEEGFHFRRLRKRPLRGLTRLEWKYGNFAGTALPGSWHEAVNRLMGDCRVVPSSDSLDGSVVASLSYFYNNWLHHLTPGWWSLNYLHGYDDRRDGVPLGTWTGRFYLNGSLEIEPSGSPAASETFTAVVTGNLLDLEADGGVGSSDTETLTWTANDSYPKHTTKEWSRIQSVVFSESGSSAPTFTMTGAYSWPVIMEDCAGLLAAMLPFDTAGDLIVGAGIASRSISQDSLSQSVNTTSSATNAGFGARILSYSKKLKQNLGYLDGQLDRREVFAV